MNVPIPQLSEARRDAAALVLCALRNDQQGVDAILSDTELMPLLKELGRFVVDLVGERVVAEGAPPELAGQAIEFALEQILQAQKA